MKALVLFSGGLDSLLALRLLSDAGLDAGALSFYSAFTPGADSLEAYRKQMEEAVSPFGVPLTVLDHSEALLQSVKAPAHGFGKNMNPCIDCRIAMLKTAADRLSEAGASFLVTGEVAGQRPMSQRRQALSLIEREAGVEGLVFRPLSAGCLPETIPEKKGWIDRKDFPAFQGRSRKPQMALAERLGINDYPGPAGGCLLTVPEYAVRVADAAARGDLDVRHAEILRLGRHFRSPSGRKIIVGKDEEENRGLESRAGAGDVLVEPADLPGPTALVLEGGSAGDVSFAASLCGRYMKVAPGQAVRFLAGGKGKARGDLEAPALSAGEAARHLARRGMADFRS